jgi:hypothetical protein
MPWWGRGGWAPSGPVEAKLLAFKKSSSYTRPEGHLRRREQNGSQHLSWQKETNSFVLRYSQLYGYPVKNSDAVQYQVCVQSGNTLPVHCAAVVHLLRGILSTLVDTT